MSDIEVTTNLPPKIVEVIDDFADAMGMTREEAILHMLRCQTIGWLRVMKAD